MIATLDEFARFCHQEARKWWYDENGNKLERNKGEMIALMHSELSEMLEGVRKNIPDEHLPEFPMEHVELVDLLIRAFDYAGAHEIPLDEIFFRKSLYNRKRADHKYEVRAQAGGKAF